MPYNGSGSFTRNYSWANDATNGILVRSDRMDGEDNNFATGLSTVICKDGQTTTTAAIPFAVGLTTSDGTALAPSVAFISESSTGLYKVAASKLGVSVSGVNTAQFSSTNFTAGTHYTYAGGTPFLAAGTINNYFQASLQNLSNGTAASTDFICTADTGTDTTNYIDVGINSSGFSSTGPFATPLDGYLYTQSSNLVIGTVASKDVIFATNNTEVARFPAAGGMTVGGVAVVTASSTNTLTNKTYDTAGTGNSFKINGTAITAVTGTGSAVLAVSPALTGSPTAPTQTQGDNSTKIATTAYADLKGPIPTNSAGAGQIQVLTGTTSVTLPAGGTWMYFVLSLTGAGAVQVAGTISGVAAGGTVLSPGSASFCCGFCWRVT